MNLLIKLNYSSLYIFICMKIKYKILNLLTIINMLFMRVKEIKTNKSNKL